MTTQNIIIIDSVAYYALAPEHFVSDEHAERESYYWDDSAGYWTQQVNGF